MADPYDEYLRQKAETEGVSMGVSSAGRETQPVAGDAFTEFQGRKAAEAPAEAGGAAATAVDVARGGLSGLYEGGAQALGLPVDAAAGVLRALGVPIGPEPYGGSANIERGLRAVGAVQSPTTGAGRFAERTAQDVGAAAATTGAGVGAARLLTGVPGKLGTALDTLAKLDVPQLLKAESLLGVVSGGGAATARAVTGKQDSFLVDLVGALTAMAGFTGARAFIRFALSTAQGLGLSKKMAERGVGKFMAEAIPEGSTYEQNLQRSVELGRQRPDIPMTTAQAAGSPPALAQETARAASAPAVGSTLASERAQTSVALRGEAAATAPASGTVSEAQRVASEKLASEEAQRVQEMSAAITRQREATTVLASRVNDYRAAAQREAQTVIGQLGPTADRATASEAILDVVRKREAELRQEAGALFDRVPKDLELNVGGLDDVLGTVTDAARGELRDAPATIQKLRAELNPPQEVARTTATFDEVRKWRSGLLNEYRREAGSMAPDPRKLRDLAQGIDAVEATLEQAGGANADYRAASAAYRDLIQRFRQGVTADILRRGPRGEATRKPIESIVQEFFRGGQGALTRAKAFIAAVGDRPQAAEALKQYAIGDFLTATVDANGAPSAKRAAAWLKKHQEPLSVFPEVRDAVNRATGALRQAEARGGFADQVEAMVRKGELPYAQNAMEFLDRTPRQAEDAAVRLFVGSDPEKAMSGILRRPDATQAARRLRQMTESEPMALNGLRRALVDEMLGQIVEREADRAGRAPLLNADAMRRFLDEHEGVFRALYPPEAYDNLRKIQALAEVSISPQATSASTSAIRAEPRSALFTVDQLLSRAYGIERGVIGTRFVASDLAVRAVTHLFSTIGQARMREVLDRALFDPEAAALLLKIGREANRADAKLVPAVNAYLANLGGPAARGR